MKITVEFANQKPISKTQNEPFAKSHGLGMQSNKILSSSWQNGALNIRKIFENVSKGGTQGVNTSITLSGELNLKGLQDFCQRIGIKLPQNLKLPEKNPLTMQKFDWKMEFQQSTLDNLLRDSAKADKKESAEKNSESDKMTEIMLLALLSGNIGLAMLIFAQMESKDAGKLNQDLTKKMLEMKEKKNGLVEKMTGLKNDEGGMKELQTLRNQVENVSDDITVIQTFMKDVTQNKQQAMELANAFIHQENQTTQNIIQRG